MKRIIIGSLVTGVCLLLLSHEVRATLTVKEELALASGSDSDRKVLAKKIEQKGNLPNFLASLGTDNAEFRILRNDLKKVKTSDEKELRNLRNQLSKVKTSNQRELRNLRNQINKAKTAVGTDQTNDPSLENRIIAVQNIIPGVSLLKGAQKVQASIDSAIMKLDSTTPNQTLSGAVEAVDDIVSTNGVNRGVDLLTDVTSVNDALGTNAGSPDLKARADEAKNLTQYVGMPGPPLDDTINVHVLAFLAQIRTVINGKVGATVLIPPPATFNTLQDLYTWINAHIN